jgi:signal transduction histidine kinase
VVETAIYRTVREALTNVRRHARASRVWIDLQEGKGLLAGTVRDDGCGFDTERAGRRHGAHLHLGLTAAAERLKLLGGQVEVHSTPGEGTVVRFSLDVGLAANEPGSGRSWPAAGAPRRVRVP